MAVADTRDDAPQLAERFVVRPEFCSNKKSYIGSYAAAIGAGNGFLVTCLHLLSALLRDMNLDATAGNARYSGTELPSAISRVNLYNAMAPNWMTAPLGEVTSMLALPEARVHDEEPFSQRDLCAFMLDDRARVSRQPLAECTASVGDPIWLVIRPGKEPVTRTVAAVVVESTASTFVYRYIGDTKGMPRFGSGAPLVNRLSEVVGLNVGIGQLNGKKFGHGIHCQSIRRHLRL